MAWTIVKIVPNDKLKVILIQSYCQWWKKRKLLTTKLISFAAKMLFIIWLHAYVQVLILTVDGGGSE